ncbi:hypothetical protein [Clostridium guangxiense]|uniref:hypothetical protein n=1 Tax=Clostridium guangxiense TaxID=1662055 RepID=UPI001E3EFAA1|nr:hypothetical protein [Clostridium guangxiense]MCD2345799.1 hypothetical protein [Clostridium guangxiense]
MYIEKKYSHNRKDFIDYFCVKIRVITNSQTSIPFLRKTDDLVDKGTRWINIKNLNDKEFLKQKNIDYIENDNEVIKEKEIIPIGLFNFNDEDNFNYGELLLWYVGSEDSYKAEYIIKNIEKAIKIKYEALKFKDKCIKNEKEKINLD